MIRLSTLILIALNCFAKHHKMKNQDLHDGKVYQWVIPQHHDWGHGFTFPGWNHGKDHHDYWMNWESKYKNPAIGHWHWVGPKVEWYKMGEVEVPDEHPEKSSYSSSSSSSSSSSDSHSHEEHHDHHHEEESHEEEKDDHYHEEWKGDHSHDDMHNSNGGMGNGGMDAQMTAPAPAPAPVSSPAPSPAPAPAMM